MAPGKAVLVAPLGVGHFCPRGSGCPRGLQNEPDVEVWEGPLDGEHLWSTVMPFLDELPLDLQNHPAGQDDVWSVGVCKGIGQLEAFELGVRLDLLDRSPDCSLELRSEGRH